MRNFALEILALMIDKRSFILLFILVESVVGAWAQSIALRGSVVDAQSREPLDFATVQLFRAERAVYGGITGADGSFELSHIVPGKYRLVVSSLGFEDIDSVVALSRDTFVTYTLRPSVTSLSEVVVTASESRRPTSASIVDRTAMQHLQPSSFTDLMELVPGGKAADPQMGQANLIRIREASITEDISSLGVGFYVDGVSESTDAGLQYVPGSVSDVNSTGTMSKGVDMRTISTDNIENVEIIRGIPSVAYGNVSNGAVIIRRRATESPITARFKADKTSKLLSVGKGINLGGNGSRILNVDLSYLDSKIDLRNSVKNYTRFTASARLNGNDMLGSGRYMRWNVSADYTGSFDNVKRDKDATVKEDAYKSDFSSAKLAARWNMDFGESSWLRELSAAASASQKWETMRETRSVSLNRPAAIATQREAGEYDGIYLPYNYVAQMEVDGRPLYITASASAKVVLPLGALSNKLRLGVDWSFQKNLGEGQVFDVARPISESLTTRPRRFKDVPGLQPFAVYAEESLELPLSGHKLSLTPGVRLQSLLGLDSKYEMQGKLYPDFRADVQWSLPSMGGWKVSFAGGLGWISRMPTTAQLYPDLKYVDLIQLNYYHTNPDYRRINMMTYTWDNTNYALEPARNRKWEVRTDVSYDGNRLSVTYFRERMNNGFGDMTYYKSLAYKLYDPASIDASSITSAPALEQLAYSTDYNLSVYSMVGNTTKVGKQGVEFQLATKRFDAIKTRLTVNGAWIKTVYSSDQPVYKASSILLDNKQLKFVGLYIDEEGITSQSFNTNFMFDTYIQRLGLTFSTSFQCTWLTSRRNLYTTGVPVSYVDQAGREQAFTDADRTNVQLQHLVEKYSAYYFEPTTVPFYMDVNLKASKRIGKFMNLSFYVNRLLGIYPDYTQREVLVRRSPASPYFGMELNLTF